MAKTITNCTLWLDKLAISSQVNQVAIQASAAELDITTFGNSGQARLAGLLDGVISAAGFWESNPDPDQTFFADTGGVVPVTVALVPNAAAGARAYLMGALLAEYKGIGAKVGNPLAFSLKAAQKDRDYSGTIFTGARLAQGYLAENRTITTTGSGNVYGPLAAPLIQQALVAALHVTAVSGTTPSLTVNLISSAVIGMTSPTTRMSFNPFTAVGSAMGQVDGPITDTYWQFTWTVSGSTPSFSLAASLGNSY
jgi:hypothetical protein